MTAAAEAAQHHRNRMALKSRQNHSAAAEIGSLPPIVDKGRREACRVDLFEDLRVYYPRSTGKNPFSPDHRRVIERMQSSVVEGSECWNMVFRGFAKTSIAVGTMIWAHKYGYRKFTPIIAANQGFAENILRMIKTQIETNDLLLDDFPELCYPVRMLEGRNQRCASQTCDGERTHIEWKAAEIRLPTIPGAPSSTGIIAAFGIDSAMNGLVRALPDGRNVRPDWFLADDLQTRKSARSGTEINNRLDALRHSVMMLGGHEDDISGCINGTLMLPNDLMAQVTNPDLFPSFSGETIPMLKEFPKALESFWLNDYARVLKDYDRTKAGDKKRAQIAAKALYESRREEADEGAVATWEHCYAPKKHEISAIQHAMNILIEDGAAVFATECQQQVFVAPGESKQLELSDIITKLSGLKRYEPPANATKLVCYIDTQDASFWYAVVAWTADFTGYVIDYGIWPEQSRRDVTKADLTDTLAKRYPHLKNKEALHRAGLADLCENVLGREYIDPTGTAHKIAAALVDVKDGDVRTTIPSWVVSQRKWRTILRPAMGVGLKAADTPFAERKLDPQKERRRGLYWHEDIDPQIPGGVIVFIDTNSAKTFVANRWRAAGERPDNDQAYRPNEPGALYLWGTDPREHTVFGSHQCSEWVKRVVDEKKREIDFWSPRPNHPDNEWWDCLSGCVILADLAGGVSLKGTGLKRVIRRPKYRTKKATQYKVI